MAMAYGRAVAPRRRAPCSPVERWPTAHVSPSCSRSPYCTWRPRAPLELLGRRARRARWLVCMVVSRPRPRSTDRASPAARGREPCRPPPRLGRPLPAAHEDTALHSQVNRLPPPASSALRRGAARARSISAWASPTRSSPGCRTSGRSPCAPRRASCATRAETSTRSRPGESSRPTTSSPAPSASPASASASARNCSPSPTARRAGPATSTRTTRTCSRSKTRSRGRWPTPSSRS